MSSPAQTTTLRQSPMSRQLTARRLGGAILGNPVRTIAVVILALILAGLIVYPLSLVLGYSFYDDQGQLGLDQFRALFQSREIIDAGLTSLIFIFSVSCGCLIIGVPLAWLVARTDIPAKILIRGGAAVAFLIPSFVSVIAWIFLLAPNSGYLNKFLIANFVLAHPPFNIFSLGGLIFIETVHLFPIVFFAVSAALANIDASHEQAARVLGAGRIRTTLTISIPLVTPAIVSSVILCMLDSLSSFGAPAAIGTMANFSVLSTEIYHLLTFPPHLSLAAALSVPIVLYTLACLWLQQRVLRVNKFTTVTGKTSAPQLIELGPLRYLLMACVLAILFCISLLPFLALIALSLLKAFGDQLTLSNLVWKHYHAVFDSSFTVLPSVENSVLLAVLSATVCILVGMTLAWMVERTTFFGWGAITGLIAVAFGVPSIILGVGVMLGYIGVLYGTLTIILIAYVSRHLPIAFVYVRSLIKQTAPELEEAARVSGAGWGRMIYDVTFPLLRPGAFIAWLLIFSLCLREQPMSAILTQSGTGVMSTMVLQFIDDGSIEVAAAISVLIVIVSVVCLVSAQLISGRRAKEVTPH